MPRIVPIQLLKCLKVLLDDNGGILSVGEVKRIAGLMTKYSKKLVSKCIYVQILKCTKTELLGEFMGVGGWTLVYNWLNDAIRAMNWPLVQEILELLLLCPVDVNRLKINSAPKLVKGLCKDGGNEGVRILARRLVEQWLKVVTENTETNVTHQVQQQSAAMTPQATTLETEKPSLAATVPTVVHDQVIASAKNTTNTETKQRVIEQDPLADVEEAPTESASYSLTPAQKKANESGLVYKIVVKDGQQVLQKLAKTPQPQTSVEEDESEEVENVVEEEAESGADAEELEPDNAETEAAPATVEEDTNSLDKKESDSSGEDDKIVIKKPKKLSVGKSSPERKLDGEMTSEKEKTDKKEQKSTKESKENKENKDRKSDKDKEKEKDKDRKSSSSSGHRSSSSSHKSSSSKSTSSSSSKSKSSSSSSSRRSSSDKHRSDKDRSSSSSSKDKDKERKEGGSSSSSSSKHRSSSSSKSSSSSSKDRHRDKDKSTSSSSSAANTSNSSSKRDKEPEKDAQASKDKDITTKLTSPSLDKLGKIPKKPKDETESETNKATSITIPSKKASMSIEIRRDSEKTKTVKTYKSQFRSHGLTEEAPPPPSRKGLKKPSSTTPLPGTVIPTSLPSSMKRSSPPPRDSPVEKKSKIDINNLSVANEKPGAIKLIAPKKIQHLVETNIFSDALSAATGPKKPTKRKRPTTPAPGGQSKEGPSPPTSPDGPKVAPLKFYQDTLDESKNEDKLDKESSSSGNSDAKKDSSDKEDDSNADKENSTEDDDDIPLKKVKEDIEQKVLREQKSTEDEAVIDISSDLEGEEKKEAADNKSTVEPEDPTLPKKPGPGCGPNGPPGVLMLHRRKGPKKKLTWRTQESLEQIRYFELDETERVNVTKTSSFMDMKNMERFSERDAINMSRRGFNHEDNMEPQTLWGALFEVDDVPPHPDGNQSRQRKVQADREQTTLRALYFSHAMIPDSPAEAEIEPHMPHDIPVIPLDDITGNPDAVNDFTSMPWPEPKGSPKYGESALAGTGGLSGLGGPGDMFGNNPAPIGVPQSPFNPFMSPYANGPGGNIGPQQQQMQMQMLQGAGPPPGGWQQPNGGVPMMGPAGGMMGGHFNGSPNMDMNQMIGPGGGPPQQNFMGPFGGPGPAGPGPFGPNGPPFCPGGFNGNPNFGPMGPVMNGPMGPGPMMNGMPHNRNNNNNNGGGNWRTGSSNFQDNSRGNGGGGGGGGGGNWRPVGSGPNRGSGNNNNGGGNNNNNGVCKAFMRGHCRLGKSCKFIHPKSKRI